MLLEAISEANIQQNIQIKPAPPLSPINIPIASSLGSIPPPLPGPALTGRLGAAIWDDNEREREVMLAETRSPSPANGNVMSINGMIAEVPD